MSMDKVWLCPTLDQSTWAELGQIEEQGKTEEFRRDYKPLYRSGNYVTLSHGQNILVDEMYLFRDVADAKQFYAETHEDREYLNHYPDAPKSILPSICQNPHHESHRSWSDE